MQYTLSDKKAMRTKQEKLFKLGIMSDYIPSPDNTVDCVLCTEGILRGTRNAKRIVIVSDYDADGICSAYIMNKYFQIARPDLPIVNIIGDRERDGYGIPDYAVKTIEKDDYVMFLDMGAQEYDKIMAIREKMEIGKPVLTQSKERHYIDALNSWQSFDLDFELYNNGGITVIDHHEMGDKWLCTGFKEERRRVNKLLEPYQKVNAFDEKTGKSIFVPQFNMQDPHDGEIYAGALMIPFPYYVNPLSPDPMRIKGRKDPTYGKLGYCTSGMCAKFFEALISTIENEVPQKLQKRLMPPDKKYTETSEYKDMYAHALNTVRILGAIGTVADVCNVNNPYDDNRGLIMRGIDAIKNASQDNTDASIGYLLQKLGAFNTRFLGTKDIGFTIAPIFNAAGRMEKYGALHLLETLLKDAPKAEDINHFIEVNNDRKNLQNDIVASEKYQKFIEEMKRPNASKVAVLIDESIPQGIMGIIAGKLSEELRRPALVITSKGKDSFVGSGRNYPGYPDMLKMFSQAVGNDPQVKFGGHRDAFGMQVNEDEDKVAVYGLKNKLQNAYSTTKETKVSRDYMSLPEKIKPEMIYGLEPFGPDYPAPYIREKVEVKNLNHLKNDYCSFTAAGLNFLGQNMDVSEGEEVVVEGELGINHFAGKESLQVSVCSVQKQKDLERSEQEEERFFL